MEQQAQILVVDDDASVRGFIEELLAIDGCLVTSVNNGKRALECIATQEFDLAIIDLKMRVVDGLKVLQELYQKSPETSAIILTGHGSMETAVKALQHGAHDYLLKPCSPELLRKSVHSGLERRRTVLSARTNAKTLADVSHQLRSHITGIGLSVELLQRDKAQRTDEYLDIIKQETQQMEQLVDNSLTLSHRELNYKETFTAENLNLLITQIIDIYQDRATERDLKMTFEPASNLLPVYVDRHQMIQAISNLIDNAIKYTPSGTIAIRTALKNVCGSVPATVLLEVQDTGIGIPQEDHAYIFERHYRGQQAKALCEDGHGLGLAIVKEIIAMHGGAVGFESQLHNGSIFRAWLPVTQ